MRGPRPNDALGTDRRGVLGALATVLASAAGGCSAVTDPSESTESEPGSTQTPEGYTEAVTELEDLYERLEAVPIAADGEFVFDPSAFEDEFDHDAVLSDVEAVRDRIRGLDAEDAERDALMRAADLAEHLARQRIALHQVVTAVFAFEDLFAAAEFGAATGVAADARQFLETLAREGNRVEALLDRTGTGPPVDGYDPASIRATQELLVEITHWSDPAYEGLGRVAEGFGRFVDANDAMERERFGAARAAFGAAQADFEAAAEAFDRARGRGRRVGYVAPAVDELRCVAPAYVEGCGRLADAVEELDAGNEARGFDRAQEALEGMDATVRRCVESETVPGADRPGT